MTDAGPPERDDLGYLLSRASQRWDTLLAQLCREYGFPEVRPAFGSVLLPLFQRDGQRISEVAAAARVSKQAMTTLVRDAVDAGLVRREDDPSDKRASRMWLTKRAEEFRPVAEEILSTMEGILAQHLPNRSIATLRRSLAVVKDLPLRDGVRSS